MSVILYINKDALPISPLYSIKNLFLKNLFLKNLFLKNLFLKNLFLKNLFLKNLFLKKITLLKNCFFIKFLILDLFACQNSLTMIKRQCVADSKNKF